MTEELREKIAEFAHLTWQRWMAYMLLHLDKEHIERWTRQANTAYADLPEQEKESDRAIAARYLALIGAAGFVELAEDQSLPELYPEVFAEGLWLPNAQELERYKKAMEWLVHEASFRKVLLRDEVKCSIVPSPGGSKRNRKEVRCNGCKGGNDGRWLRDAL